MTTNFHCICVFCKTQRQDEVWPCIVLTPAFSSFRIKASWCSSGLPSPYGNTERPWSPKQGWILNMKICVFIFTQGFGKPQSFPHWDHRWKADVSFPCFPDPSQKQCAVPPMGLLPAHKHWVVQTPSPPINTDSAQWWEPSVSSKTAWATSAL